MRPISDPIPNNLNIVWVGHNWEKYFIALFHVSEHLDHFKAIFFLKIEIFVLIFFENLSIRFTKICVTKFQK
jgi:hypothetical protein